MTRDERAKALIEAEVRKGWPDIVEAVSVTPRIDFLDEPAFDVLVTLKSIRQVPGSWAIGEMLVRLDDALKASGDERGTHIGFSAPDEVVEHEEPEEAES